MVKITKKLPSTEEIVEYFYKVDMEKYDSEEALVATVRHFIIKSR